MKYIKLIACFICAFAALSAQAQMPQAFSYQGVLTDGNGQPIKNKEVNIRVNLRNNESATTFYKETHEVTTNLMGFFTLQIGKGNVTEGAWNSIPWTTVEVSLRVDIDTLKNGNYFIFANNQLLSVPYALFAQEVVHKDTVFVEDSNRGKILNVDEAFYILSKEKPKDTLLTILEDGRIGVGVTNPRDGIELAVDKRIHLSSTEWHLETSGVITMQALNDSAKPALTWFDEFGNIHAAMTTYDRSRVDPKFNKQFAIETDDGNGNMLPRFVIPYFTDWTEIRTHNSNFRVSDKGTFYVGKPTSAGKAFIYGNAFVAQRLGIGQKDWEVSSPFTNPNSTVEVYSENSIAEVLVYQKDGEHEAAVNLQRGDNSWKMANDGKLNFAYNDTNRLTIAPTGQVGIGTTEPQHTLDVNGNISSRASFVVQNSGYACYFEVSAPLSAGDIVGVSPSGQVRAFAAGDAYLGVVCENAGIIANFTPDKADNPNWVLVALTGTIDIDKTKVDIESATVKIKDTDVFLGYKITETVDSVKVFMK